MQQQDPEQAQESDQLHNDEIHQNIWLRCMQNNNANEQQAHEFILHIHQHINCRITQAGLTLVMVACSIGNLHIVRQCIDHGSDLTLTDFVSGRTALHYCSAVGNQEIFSLLIAHQMNPLSQTIGGETALHKACIFSQESIIEWYLNERPEAFEVPDNCNHTPLNILHLSDKELYQEVNDAYLDLMRPN